MPLPDDTFTIVFRDLSRNKTHRLRRDLDSHALDSLAQTLDVVAIRKARLDMDVTAAPKGWDITGTIGATAVQTCVVTGAPVTTRIDADFLRKLRPMVDPGGTETEMDADTDIEPLGDSFDILGLLAEEIALHLPDFPRADGAAFDGLHVGPPGQKAMTDDDAKPLAGLAALKAKLQGESADDS